MPGDLFDVCYGFGVCVTLHVSCLYAILDVAGANFKVAIGFDFGFSESLSFCNGIVGNGPSGDQVGEEKCRCGNEFERELHGC
jgi:hypothetical protein